MDDSTKNLYSLRGSNYSINIPQDGIDPGYRGSSEFMCKFFLMSVDMVLEHIIESCLNDVYGVYDELLK